MRSNGFLSIACACQCANGASGSGRTIGAAGASIGTAVSARPVASLNAPWANASSSCAASTWACKAWARAEASWVSVTGVSPRAKRSFASVSARSTAFCCARSKASLLVESSTSK